MQTTKHIPDWPLLRQYVEQNSQDAFGVLVKRHINLVHATCRREVGDMGLAEDVTQAVFLILARKAPGLRAGTHLPGWLFQTARFAAKNARTQELRRRQYEQKAARMMESDQNIQNDALWDRLEPFLNDAVARLSAQDREAILLRYWEDQSLAETGEALGVSEDAARKRVARAVERLRRLLGKQGILVPGVALAVLLSDHAANAAPAMLTPAIAQMTAALTGPISTSLAGSSVYQLSQGILHAMKIVQVKSIILITASAAIGLTTIAVGREISLHGTTTRTAVPASTSAALSGKRVMAETSRFAQTTLSVSQILQRSQQVYDALNSYQVVATATTNAVTGASPAGNLYHSTTTIQFVRPGKIRAEGRNMFGQSFAFVSDGSTTYETIPGSANGWKKSEDIQMAIAGATGTAQETATVLPDILLDIKTANLLSPSQRYNPEIREDNVGDNDCYVLTISIVSQAAASTRSVWIDKKTFLLRRTMIDISTNVFGTAVKSHIDQVFTNEKINEPISASTFVVTPTP